ncbi:MAG: HdeD family acid-resistance protein [Alphaproteobacteria bacterium]|nr:hypothetical protein [Hyphomonas sp.]MBR9806769.1 HdeD family acid-resistance protein [Alphaproteobacteria bacterium]|tara:strand:- start:353 stop:859 length:507 start_codon:yes stop_codon:yes gene_type:complete
MKTAGIIFLILGALAILFPFIAGLSYNFILAYLIIIGGAVHFWWAWRPSLDGKMYHLLLALLYFAGGIALLVFPMISLLSFTIVLGVSFLAQGIVQLALALSSNRLQGRGKGMLVISGLLGLLAGLFILIGLPSSATWAVGTLAGVNMLIFGASLLAMDKALAGPFDD